VSVKLREVKQSFCEAYSCLNKVVSGEPDSSCQRTKENAFYWMAVLNLMGVGKTKRSVSIVRKLLETANADDDHEQANAILNFIGKSKYLPHNSSSIKCFEQN
jgi:hypothetical protein